MKQHKISTHVTNDNRGKSVLAVPIENTDTGADTLRSCVLR